MPSTASPVYPDPNEDSRGQSWRRLSPAPPSDRDAKEQRANCMPAVARRFRSGPGEHARCCL